MRPYRAFAGSLCDAMQHNLPLFLPPSNHLEYPLPSVVFRLFDYTDVPEDVRIYILELECKLMLMFCVGIVHIHLYNCIN